MRHPLGAFFFLFQRRLAEAPEPRRQTPGSISVSERPSVSTGTFLQDGVDAVPRFAVDDGVVLSGIALALVDRLADIGAVRQHPVEVLLFDPVATLGADAARADLARQFRAGADFEEPGEDPAHMTGGLIVDNQFSVLHEITVGRHAPHPHALPAAGGDLVADALGRHLALELGEGEQDVQCQPPHGCGGVERLRHRDEGHAIAVKHLDQLGEVGERAAEAVDLVDDDHVDQPRQALSFFRS